MGRTLVVKGGLGRGRSDRAGTTWRQRVHAVGEGGGVGRFWVRESDRCGPACRSQREVFGQERIFVMLETGAVVTKQRRNMRVSVASSPTHLHLASSHARLQKCHL